MFPFLAAQLALSTGKARRCQALQTIFAGQTTKRWPAPVGPRCSCAHESSLKVFPPRLQKAAFKRGIVSICILISNGEVQLREPWFAWAVSVFTAYFLCRVLVRAILNFKCRQVHLECPCAHRQGRRFATREEAAERRSGVRESSSSQRDTIHQSVSFCDMSKGFNFDTHKSTGLLPRRIEGSACSCIWTFWRKQVIV